jgi:hypothetical protein
MQEVWMKQGWFLTECGDLEIVQKADSFAKEAVKTSRFILKFPQVAVPLQSNSYTYY